METQVHRILWITPTVLVGGSRHRSPTAPAWRAASKLSDAQKIASSRSAAPLEISTGATNHGLAGRA